MKGFCTLAEIRERKQSLMFRHRFSPSSAAGKGYAATERDWYDYAFQPTPDLGEQVMLDPDGDAVVTQLWTLVGEVINHTADLMSELLDVLGVPSEEKSPFCRHFNSPEELRDVFIKYLPRTFKFDRYV